MCFFSGGPSTPSVDPEAERRKAEAEATAKANAELQADARRKRQQKGVLATEDAGVSVLAAAAPKPTTAGATVLGSGGAM
jgi:hypothetical protein